jgi:hypothetical protein
MPQIRDANGYVVPGTFDRYDNPQSVAYTGTAGTIPRKLGTAGVLLTHDATNVTANDTVTLNGKIYTFVTPVGSTEGNILIGASADATMVNLERAIMHTGTPDTDYKCALAHPTIAAATTDQTANTLLLTALTAGAAGNELTCAEGSTHLTLTFVGVAATKLRGGIDQNPAMIIKVMITTAGFIKIGPSPTATTADIPMAANVPEFFRFSQGDQVSAIQSASGGTLYVMECN